MILILKGGAHINDDITVRKSAEMGALEVGEGGFS